MFELSASELETGHNVRRSWGHAILQLHAADLNAHNALDRRAGLPTNALNLSMLPVAEFSSHELRSRRFVLDHLRLRFLQHGGEDRATLVRQNVVRCDRIALTVAHTHTHIGMISQTARRSCCRSCRQRMRSNEPITRLAFLFVL